MTSTDTEKKVLTYKTMVFGTQSSGKTVFMSSMFQHLSIQHADTGFFLVALPNQQRNLMSIFRTVRDPELSWPITTQQFEEWNFTCQIREQRQNFPVFDFIYYDYPGEILTEAQSEGSPLFNDYQVNASNADSCLVFLDGQKIKAWLAGVRPANSKTTIMEDLDSLLPEVQKLGKPTHFVITKWDLFIDNSDADQNEILKNIKSALLEHESFKSIVLVLQNEGMPARLIPVSAIGQGFAQPDANGNMQKLANTQPKPFQVEIPIALILLDAFQGQHVRLSFEQQSLLKKIISGNILGDWFRDVNLIDTLPLLPRFRLGRQAISLLIEILDEGLDKSNLEVWEDKRSMAISKIRKQPDALRVMILNYVVLAKKLLQSFPASDLYN